MHLPRTSLSAHLAHCTHFQPSNSSKARAKDSATHLLTAQNQHGSCAQEGVSPASTAGMEGSALAALASATMVCRSRWLLLPPEPLHAHRLAHRLQGRVLARLSPMQVSSSTTESGWQQASWQLTPGAVEQQHSLDSGTQPACSCRGNSSTPGEAQPALAAGRLLQTARQGGALEDGLGAGAR